MIKSCQNTKFAYKIAVIWLILALFLSFLPHNTALANQDEINRLNTEINEKQSKIDELNKEIERQRAALNSAAGRSNNLNNTIAELEATKKKLENDISATQTQIEKAELTIKKLNLEITDKELAIRKNSDALAKTVRKMNQLEQYSLIERFLNYDSLSDFWLDFESMQNVQKRLHTEVNELNSLQESLIDKENEKTLEKMSLAKQRDILSGETAVIKSTAAEKAALLKKTKQEEAEYQKILNQKMAERQAFEKELLEIESQLNFLIDSDSYPVARKGILGWPLDKIIVTQEFGGTQFAKNNPGIYGRAYHPGTDLGIPIGTQVKSVSDGVVKGFDNTDKYPGCYAWGGWVLIEHDNGLSSLYAHLSRVIVSQGQRVKKGEVIALSGNTGISTGPHLHLSIYASQGVKIGRYGDYKGGTGCGATNATGPFADLEAYLDPMTYLPNE